MKVEAKDIPIIQSFMTEYWKAIKEFYSAELTDEYSSKVYDTCTELGELAGTCPDENDKQFLLDNIPFTVNYVGERVKGKFDISSGTFTADSE